MARGTCVNPGTVRSYSTMGASAYEDPMNKNFVYGDITVRFIRGIEFSPQDHVILDIGCGTGFVFDEFYPVIKERTMRGIGVDPADGMLQIAKEKYAHEPDFSFLPGSFDSLPVDDRSVDKITSTLALHWVTSMEAATAEMCRVLKDTGSADILMIAKDDGANFKKAVLETLKKHLSFRQIMRTAELVQRVRVKEVVAAFQVFESDFHIEVEEKRDIVYGSFDDHMKWWKARSTPVIREVEDKAAFMVDLRNEFEKLRTSKGIPFDAAVHWIKLKTRGK